MDEILYHNEICGTLLLCTSISIELLWGQKHLVPHTLKHIRLRLRIETLLTVLGVLLLCCFALNPTG